MKKIFLPIFFFLIFSCGLIVSCNQKDASHEVAKAATDKVDYGGYDSQVKYGEHLVTICGCNDCHTPKKMGPNGPVPDNALLLSGHPSQMAPPDVNRKEMESKGVISTSGLTAWTGPWGTSYTANLTPDPTGIGNWDEETFFRAIRLGKYKGIESGRTLLPPMPWEELRHMTDNELKAVFAYLKSIPPVKNVVPAPEPPVLAQK
jgi:hypothetical protein